jgi:DNA-directed RNA polymerase specialized sigma24 family protein
MLRKKEDRLSTTRVQGYATQDEFCRIFAEDENALYLLALLLTADASKAEQCFVAGLEDSIQGNRVFKEWVRSWSRRMIIKNAIRMISPAPGQVYGGPHVSDFDGVTLDLGSALTAVLQLAPLERFVFVMSVLEGYSIQECSILLNCAKQYIEIAQAGALQHVALTKSNRLTQVVPGSDIAQAAHFLEPVPAA